MLFSYVISFGAIIAIITVFVIASLWEGFQFYTAKSNMLSYILIIAGIVLNIICFLWFLAVHFNMGSAWSPQPEALKKHKLITSGLFGFCRHPMYTGFLYYTIPIALLTLNWFITLGWFIIIFCYFIIYRIPIEEVIMVQLFGQEYLDYRENVPPVGPYTGFLNSYIENHGFGKLKSGEMRMPIMKTPIKTRY